MTSFRKGCSWTVIALVLLMILGIGADQIGAQEPVGSISGRVTRDSGGTGISSVRVDVYTTSLSFVKSVLTDSSGNYTVSLPAGSYYLATLNQEGYIDEYYNNVTKAGNSWPPAGVIAVNVIIGSNTPNINFGLSWGGSISGRVTNNSDGTGIQNVEIDVYDNNWRYLNSTFTGSSGYYTMGGLPGGGGLPAGTYYLATSNQQGYIDEYYRNVTKAGSAWPPAGVIAVTVTTGLDTPNIDFGLSWGGSISGRVVKDSDGTGIENVQIDVYDNNWNHLNSTFTNSSGGYTLEGLPAGNYYLGTSNHQGYMDEYYNNLIKAGSSWPPAGNAVSVTSGSGTPNINFGLSQGGSISGRVVKDSGGTGIENVKINVYNTSWNQVGSTFTDSSGAYTVGGLLAGDYYLRTSNYLGYIDEYYNNVTNSGAATLVGVTAGSNTAGINFGLAMNGSISGRVVNDSNGMGIQGILMSVYDTGSNLVQQGITDSSGNYVAGSLPTGSYYVGTWNQGGYFDEYYDNATNSGGATPVSVTGGFNTPNINFGLTLSGSISGRVVRDPGGTGIEGVNVYIYNSGRIYVMDVSTNSFGNYTAGGLLPGSYYVGTSNDVGYLDEYYDNISKAGSSGPPAGAAGVSVVAGSDTSGINFGLALGGSISGRVTRVFDGAGIRNIQVRAYDTSWNPVKNSRTNTSGDYRISGLMAGNYYLSTSNSNSQGYIDVYYNNTISSSTATLVSVTLGLDTPNINFGLPLMVGNPAPTITGITPSSGGSGTTVSITNLAGTGFLAGATVKLTRSGSANINATSVVVVSPTQITCTFNLTGAAVGQWNVVVTNFDAQSVTLNSGFTVTNSVLTVSAITPSTGVSGATVNITNLAGTGFLAGAAVKLTKASSADINAASIVIISSTQITCAFNLAGAATGQWNVVVTNADTQFGTLSNGFTGYYDLFIIHVSKDGSCNGHNPCFPNIRNGIALASAPSIIKITQETYNENIILDFAEVILLQGGWDANFTSNASYTTINGSITVTNGTMIIENIILK